MPVVKKGKKPVEVSHKTDKKNASSSIDKKSILVVDDDELIVETLHDILELGGYKVETALSGIDAKKLSLSKYFNLALLDIKLPDVSGLDLLKWLRSETPRTIIIMMTGYPSLDNAVESLNFGASAYIIKPVDPSNLLTFVETKLKDQHNKEVSVLDEILPNYLEALNDGNLHSVSSIAQKMSMAPMIVEKISVFCSDTGMIKYWRNKGVVQLVNREN